MSYAAAAELSLRLGSTVYSEIYGQDLTTPAADLESAAAEIDGAVSYRYAVPATGSRTLALLKDWNLTLAEERAYARTAGGDFSEKVKSRCALVRKYLDMIRSDRFSLPDAPEKGASNGISLVKNDPPVFGRGKMSGF